MVYVLLWNYQSLMIPLFGSVSVQFLPNGLFSFRMEIKDIDDAFADESRFL